LRKKVEGRVAKEPQKSPKKADPFQEPSNGREEMEEGKGSAGTPRKKGQKSERALTIPDPDGRGGV